MGLNIINTKNTTDRILGNSIISKKKSAKRKQKIFLKDLTFTTASKKDIDELKIKSYDFVL